MSYKNTYSTLETTTATFAAGASTTNAINTYGLRLFSIVLPADWTTADLTFQSSYDGGATWQDVYKSGAEYVVSSIAAKDLDVDFQRFSSISMIKVRSGTSSTPVAQAAARSLTLVLRGI